ncbi:uncharacterized protein UDID_18113 [Ustilago sp. UG-2017a]|nr:uncharacterized protein UDID_18113 [Ustilago sp. UG-2017a]
MATVRLASMERPRAMAPSLEHHVSPHQANEENACRPRRMQAHDILSNPCISSSERRSIQNRTEKGVRVIARLHSIAAERETRQMDGGRTGPVNSEKATVSE